MLRRRRRMNAAKRIGLISGAVAGGLIPLIPALRRRAMRVTSRLRRAW